MFLFRKTLLNQLVTDGWEVIVLTPFDYNVTDLKELGTTVIETPLNRRSLNPFDDLNLIRLYRQIFKKVKPDFIITYTVKPNIYAGFLASKMGIPYAVNITGLGSSFQNSGLLKYLIIKMYRAALKKVKVVFFENSECCRLFVGNGMCSSDVAYVLNGAGVDLDYFSVSEYPYQECVVFLFIGRMMKEKGVNELFEAARRLFKEKYSIVLWLVGSLEEDFYREIERYSSEGWLVYYGHQNDVRPFIEKSNCFVLPSWHEGMANTNLESAAMGRPLITSDIPGCRESVENNITGFLCEKQNAEDLYMKMKQFLSLSYEQQKTMGVKGRNRMEELFDRRLIVTETLQKLNTIPEFK